MKPLETNQRVLTWLYAVAPDKSGSKVRKIAYIAVPLIMILYMIISDTFSAVFIYRNVSSNLVDTLYSLFHTVGCFSSLYQSIATILLRHKLMAIFDSLAKIYDENKNGDSYYLLKRTNDKCEWIWTLFLKYVLGGFFASTIINITIYGLYCYISYGHFVAEHAYHPFKFILPWNQSTPLGYSLEIGFDIVGGEIFFIPLGTLLILFISMCLHHQTFYKMFRNEASKLNNRDKHRNDAEHLSKMIRFHISVKDWFLDSANTFSTYILVQLICGMILLACVVFQLDLQIKHPGFEMVIICMGTTLGTSVLFAYCYFGKSATESYEKMAGCLYLWDWHELSPKLQKHLLVMMINAQRPIYYHGFGVANLDLEKFTDMNRAVYSYYMMFKTLTAD